MENAVDALYMAGSMLIFIVALSVAISSFTTVRAGIDEMMGYTEVVDIAQYDNESYVNYMKTNEHTDGLTRIVGAETVISSMYRSLKENYVIYINFEKINDIDEGWDIKEFNGKKYVQITVDARQTNVKMINDEDQMEKFYDIIKNLTFKEYLGEYQENTEATSENKITYRIITYEQKLD